MFTQRTFTQATPALGPARWWPSTVRRRAGAASMVGMFAALTVSSLVDPLGTNHGQAAQLRNATGHLGALQASSMLELLAAVFAIGTIAAFLGVVRQRGAALANVGAVIGIPGCVGMALIGAHGLFLHALVSSQTANGPQILSQLQTAAGPVQILFFAMPVAIVLLVAAVVRAGIAPKAALVLAVVFFVADAISGLPGGEPAALVIGLIAVSWIAWRIVALTEPAAPNSADKLGSVPERTPVQGHMA